MVESPTANSTSPPKHCMLESASVSLRYLLFTTLSVTTLSAVVLQRVAPLTSLLFPLPQSPTANSTSPPKHCTLESASVSLRYSLFTTLSITTLSAVVLQRVAPPTSLLFPLPLTTLAVTTPLRGCTAESCSSDFATLPAATFLTLAPAATAVTTTLACSTALTATATSPLIRSSTLWLL